MSEQSNKTVELQADKPSNKIKNGSVAVGSEISGVTFLKRGITSNLRAVSKGGDFLKHSFSSFRQSQSYSEESLVKIGALDIVERQIKQANSLLTFCLSLSVFMTGLIVFLSMNSGVITSYITEAFEGKHITYGFGIIVGLLGCAYIIIYGYVALLDFRKISSITAAPKELSAQYRSSFNAIVLIYLLQSLASTIMQSAPDLSIIRTVAGIFAITLSISLFNSARFIFNPSRPPVSNINILSVILKSLLGFSTSRYKGKLELDHGSVSLIICVMGLITAMNFISKEASVISMFSLFSTALGLGVILAMYIHGWRLKND